MALTLTPPLTLVGIHTDIGKTITAAVLTQALGCDYWKPVQAGSLSNSDSDVVRGLVSNPLCTVHPEAFRLSTPVSPHLAARLDGIDIGINDFKRPLVPALLIETAGGAMSPMTSQHTVADVVSHYGWPAILVVQHFLGSISLTLSAVDALRSRGVSLLGLIINGDANPDSEQFIVNYTQRPILARIPQLHSLTPETLAETARLLRPQLLTSLSAWNRV